MFSSKHATAIFSLLVCVSLPATSNALVFYTSIPTITLSASGAAPIYSGIPVCTQNVGLTLVDKSGAVMNIDSVYFVKDTLHVIPGNGSIVVVQPATAAAPAAIVSPVYSGYTTVFQTWGTYTVVLKKAVIVDTLVKDPFTAIGTVLIRPCFSTQPRMPLSSSATQLNLTLGQSHTVCNPTYTNLQVRIKADTITLKYTETPFQGACAAIYAINPITYGPSYDLGVLDTGTYVVKIDTMTIGTMNVAAGFSITGIATVMKDPYTKSMSLPIANALITGVVYIPCPTYTYQPSNFDTVSATTGASGAFSLLLPRANYQYTVNAEKSGYYPQSITVNTAASVSPLSFQLIPASGMDTVGTLNVTVTKNAAPVESVYVSLYSGHGIVLCPLLAKREAMVSAGIYTDKTGTISFNKLSLIPFIDYSYSVSYNKNGFSFSTSGTIRLNPLVATNLDIDMGNTGIIAHAALLPSMPIWKLSGRTLMLSFPDQKFGKQVNVGLFDIRGRTALHRSAENNGRIDLSSLAAGRYLMRISSPQSVTTEPLMLP